ncbi:MAG: hypothetical protein A3G34_15165 [Candidatus Lindowbacteria bacterium RIFCSPLOWO2_12_FULL_62_27]|nr:MAG: hypothetical protein A3G34_15165 [Candidatus Lindowbacteria bacterium RIFCSPLOWO2_12_FULL_62_27]OGH63864.1 MAG: hypothetical protein A3I06_06145 [Candidatus Lindowbacteria bacterium RIFCSPLOWO2_02_FULL_62_12]
MATNYVYAARTHFENDVKVDAFCLAQKPTATDGTVIMSLEFPRLLAHKLAGCAVCTILDAAGARARATDPVLYPPPAP